ncbi:MAG: 50S ribosomal protein L37ae [Candidatus Hodarchaeales archaeon]
MPRTKKLGITGRFGTRYGSTLRKRVKFIEDTQKQWHICPQCNSKRVKRVSIGIWACRKCDFKFTGGSYSPLTESGKKSIADARRLNIKK